MFYGWKLLVALCAIYFLTTGFVFYGFSVIMPAMIEDLGWTLTEASLGFSLLFLMPGLSGPLVALLIGRLGARFTMTLGGLLAAAGAVSMYFMTSLTQYYISIGPLIGFGVAMQTIIPGTQVLANWFANRRALALGVFMAMGGAGAFVAAPAFSYLLEVTGNWRIAWLVMAAATLTSSVLALFVVRDRPEDMGTVIDGGEQENISAETEKVTPKAVNKSVYKTLKSWQLKDAVRTASFWIIVAAASMVVLGQTIVSSQGMIHLIDLGIPSVIAGGVLGTVGMLSACGRLFTGFVGDNYDPRYMLAGGLVLELLALILFNYADSVTLAYVFAVIFGAGNGMAIVASPALVVNYFGNENYASMIGLRGLIITPIAASGPLIAASSFEATGSYSSVFMGFAVVAMIPIVVVMLMRPPQQKLAQEVVTVAVSQAEKVD
ncbi:MAG: MFS transporter [Pseudomonadales bacterium]|nr:MFS transporter [Pseudomonadales bacterium]